jgi:uncharacterized protein (TIGR03083 family)
MEHWDTIAAERRALADQLDGLSPDQWATQSLCGAWTVRDVAAHLLVGPTVSIPIFAVAMVRARGNFNRANEAMTARLAVRSTTDLVAELRARADSRFKPPGFGSEAPLTDVLIHGQDIRVPLGLDTPRPLAPWRDVLEFVVTPKARKGFVGAPLPPVHIEATDLEFSHGSGQPVSGPAIALALALLGRPALAAQLEGPGVGLLLGTAGS